MELLVTLSSPASCHFLKSKYSPQQSVLKHTPGLENCLQAGRPGFITGRDPQGFVPSASYTELLSNSFNPVQSSLISTDGVFQGGRYGQNVKLSAPFINIQTLEFTQHYLPFMA